MNASRIRLHINELVLHGFSPCDGRRIADSVQTELTRLLEENGIPAELMRSAAVEFVDAGEFKRAAAASGKDIGTGLSAALYGGLKL